MKSSENIRKIWIFLNFGLFELIFLKIWRFNIRKIRIFFWFFLKFLINFLGFSKESWKFPKFSNYLFQNFLTILKKICWNFRKIRFFFENFWKNQKKNLLYLILEKKIQNEPESSQNFRKKKFWNFFLRFLKHFRRN